jgi:hypothetical protein
LQNLSSAAAVVIVVLGCAGDIPVRPPSSEHALPSPRDPRRCEYLNFDIFDHLGESQRQADSIREIMVSEVEAVFAQELESAGFHRVLASETPWLFLRAMLQPSKLASNAMVGAVHLGPLSNLHRDYWSAVSEGSILEGEIGMTLAVEIRTPSQGLELDSIRLEEHAREKARRVWDRSAPVLFELCHWRRQLSQDGLSVEDIRRELVEEMDRIRREYHRAEQRRNLKLEVEP